MGFTVRAFIFITIFFVASVTFGIGLMSAFGVSSGIEMPELPKTPKDLNWLNPLSYGAIFSYVWDVISYVITCISHFGTLVLSLPSPLNTLVSAIFGLFFFIVLVEWVRG
jgi:hypothetical protein